jgi:extradiol dioxygenase family protein
MSNNVSPFHLAIPVIDLDRARSFYGKTLGCPEGRSSDDWTDFDFFGHQLVVHRVQHGTVNDKNDVDGVEVPVPHFGVVLDSRAFHTFAECLKAAGVSFVIEPSIRFKGQIGEQTTMFFRDPDGNALEFKTFADPTQLFAK